MTYRLSADHRELLRRWFHAEVCPNLPEGGLSCDELADFVTVEARHYAAEAIRGAADRFPDAYVSSVSDWLNDQADRIEADR